MGASFSTDSAWASATTLRTPFVAVHRQRLQANIDRIAALARRHGVTVRPHAKTHKDELIVLSEAAKPQA